MSIADYLQRKEALQQQKQQNLIGNILSAVKTGTDVWGALQESGKYKPGSDFMKYETMKRDWGNEDFQKHLDQTLQFNQDWLRFQNENPGASEEEKKWKFLQTPEGKSASEQSYQEWIKTYNVEQKGRMDLAKIATSAREATKGRTELKDVLDDITSLRPDWVVMDPTTGQPRLDIEGHGKEIQDAILSYYGPEDRAWVTSILSKTLAGYRPVSAPGAAPVAQGGPTQAPSPEQVTNGLIGAGIVNAVTGNAIGGFIAPILGLASTALVPAAITEGLYRLITGNSLIGKVPALRDWINKLKPGFGDKLLPREMYIAQGIKNAASSAARGAATLKPTEESGAFRF